LVFCKVCRTKALIFICCRIAHGISWHTNMDEDGTSCERKEILRFGKFFPAGTHRKRTELTPHDMQMSITGMRVALISNPACS
jgi:hypothetical protein